MAVDGNKYTDPQLDEMQRARDLTTLSPKRDISIKPLPSVLRETLWKRREKDEGANEDGRNQGNNPFQTQED